MLKATMLKERKTQQRYTLFNVVFTGFLLLVINFCHRSIDALIPIHTGKRLPQVIVIIAISIRQSRSFLSLSFVSDPSSCLFFFYLACYSLVPLVAVRRTSEGGKILLFLTVSLLLESSRAPLFRGSGWNRGCISKMMTLTREVM